MDLFTIKYDNALLMGHISIDMTLIAFYYTKTKNLLSRDSGIIRGFDYVKSSDFNI